MKLSPEVINIITNVAAFVLVVAEPLNAYFQTQPFNVLTFIICIAGAVVSYFTGKGAIAVQNRNKV